MCIEKRVEIFCVLEWNLNKFVLMYILFFKVYILNVNEKKNIEYG